MNIDPNAIMQQAAYHQSVNEYDKALALISSLLKYLPKHPDINHFYANLLCSSGQSAQAVPFFKKAVKGKNKDAKIWNDFATAYKNIGQFSYAIACFEKALRFAPNTPEILVNLGSAYQSAKKYKKAISSIKKAIKARPNYPVAYLILGNLQKKNKQLNEAINSYKQAITFNPNYYQACYNLALLLKDTEEYSQSLGYCKKSLEIKPGYYAALALGGQLNEHLGNITIAKEFYLRCIESQPESTGAYWNLANLDRNSFPVEIVEKMQLLNQSSIPDESKVYLLFALAKEMESQKNYPTAFEYLQQANQLKKKQFEGDVDNGRRLIESIRTRLNQQILSELKNKSDQQASPIFIIGMPRSGTSLIEQILASHTEVASGGELETSLQLLLDELPKLTGVDWQSSLNQLDKRILQQLANQYCEINHQLVNQKAFFTDKLPLNFAMVGFLSLLFPKAKFVHVYKQPLDSCLSCFKQLFTVGQEFSYSLQDLADYYLEYQAIMKHWSRLIPEKIIHVSYEELISNPTEQVKQMLEFLLLPWQDDCLQFYKRSGIVKTASAAQVRQGIYNTSVGRWRNYETQLASLKDKLSTCTTSF
jgi:tetratricopeptide (TPR) repeat protein